MFGPVRSGPTRHVTVCEPSPTEIYYPRLGVPSKANAQPKHSKSRLKYDIFGQLLPILPIYLVQLDSIFLKTEFSKKKLDSNCVYTICFNIVQN